MSCGNQPVPPDVLRMIEEKRQKAIELRKRKLEEQRIATSRNVINTQRFPPDNHRPPPTINSNKSPRSDDASVLINVFTEIKNKSSSCTQPKANNPPTTDAKSPQKQIKISFLLENSNRFTINVEYHSDIVKIFRDITSKRWDPVTKNWSFSIKDYQNILSKLRALKHLDIKYLEMLPENVMKQLVDIESKKCDIDLSERFNSKFLDSLFSYQRDGIIFGIQRQGRCLIADDMGLGKTIQAIGLALWYRDDWPLIIVCPSSLRYQWMKSILRWCEDLSEKDIHIITNTKDAFPRVPITITSYDLMSRMKVRFTVEQNRFYSMIIMDESHYIKSDISQRTSTALLIAKSCKRVVLLSGTPALSRPIELFPQLNIIDQNLFPSKHGFGLRYCNAQQKTIFRNRKPVHVWDYKGAKNLDELRIILENSIMVRRLKRDVLNELPNKKREMICLSTDAMNEKERNTLSKFKVDITKSKRNEDRTSLAFRWFALSASAKVPAVNEYLSDILKRDIKLICFCHHKVMLDGVEDMLNTEKINHIRIDGSTPPKVRQEACEVFQTNPNFKVALLSLTACATGLNLTAATLVIFTETYWNPGLLAQAEDRVHRIGQQENVRVIYLVARGTIDEMIWPLISKKLDILNKAGLSRDTFDNTANPLEVNQNQALITEFVNSLDKSDFQPMLDDDESQH